MMDSIREGLGRLLSFFRKGERDRDFNEELSAHLDFAVQDFLAQGLSEQEARRRALLSIGGMGQARELHRESRGLPAVETIQQDLRYCFRTLRRDVGLTIFSILILGFGVGASSTVFNIFNALLLRPLPFTEPSRLVWIANGDKANLSSQTVQVSDLLEFRAQSKSFSDVAGYSPFYGAGDIRLTGRGDPERLTGVPVSENFFPLLGVQPHMGRLFTAEECRWGAAKTAILSYDLWQRHFASDPGIVGRPIVLDDAPVTVVGVMPERFDFPALFAPGSRVDLFVPFPLSPQTDRKGNTLALIGRLNPGASVRTAQAEASAIGGSILPGRGRNGFRPRVSPLRDRLSGRFRSALFVLVGAVGFVMLIVCVNLSNLLLARASARQKEMAIRAALGAGRRRLIRQMLIESVTLSLCGAVLGLVLAIAGTRLLASMDWTTIPLLRYVRVDATALGFTLLVAVLTGILFGLMPALQISALSPYSALKEGSRGSTGGAGAGWTRGSLVVCEIALACVLLTGAGLLMRSLIRVLDVDLGFNSTNVAAVRIDPSRAYSTSTRKAAYFEDVLRGVRSLPGVDSAGLTDALPLGQNYGWRLWSLTAKGQVYEQNKRPQAMVRVVGDGYLETMRISLRAGRGFTQTDNASAAPVIVINDTLAQILWPGEDPLGRTVQISGEERRVVGVVHGVRYFGPEQDSGAEMYLPIGQTHDYASVDLVVRSKRSLTDLAPMVASTLRSIDPNLPVAGFRPMGQLVDRAVFARRSVVLLLSGFAAFALILAALGIYGVISYSVNQRRQEIGIRLALGSSAGRVQSLVLRHTVKLALIGIALGAAASWMTARAFQGLLFGVTVTDPETFAVVVLVLSFFALLAGYLPARRASKLDPLDALRCE